MMAKVSSPSKKQGYPTGCTPLCPKSGCSQKGKHHELIMSMLKCTNATDAVKSDFKNCLNKYQGEDWFHDKCVPDKNENLQFPLVHWACILGKHKTLDYMVTERGFDISVKGKGNLRGPLFSLVKHLSTSLGAKASQDYVSSVFAGVLDVVLKHKAEVIVDADSTSKDTILHYCAEQISSDALAVSYLKIILEKIKECSEISLEKRKELLEADNHKGKNILHLLVETEKSLTALVYFNKHFKDICSNLSIMKDKSNRTPRQIAVEIQSFTILKVLGAPALVLNSLAKAVKSVKSNSNRPRARKSCNNSARTSLVAASEQQNTTATSAPSPAGNGLSVPGSTRLPSEERNSMLPNNVRGIQQGLSQTPNSDRHEPSSCVESSRGDQEPVLAAELREREVVDSDHSSVNIKEEVISPAKDNIEPFSPRYTPNDSNDADGQEAAAVRDTFTKGEDMMTDRALDSVQPQSEEMTGHCIVNLKVIKAEPVSPVKTVNSLRVSHTKAATALGGNTAEASGAQTEAVDGIPNGCTLLMPQTRKRSAPMAVSNSRPNKKRSRLATFSSDSESDEDLIYDDESDNDMDSEEEEDGDGEDDDEEDVDLEGADESEDDKQEIEGPRHTPFCTNKCDFRHDDLLVGLMKCTNSTKGSSNVNTFLKQVNDYINKPGKSPRSLADGDIPDPEASFRYPLVHWACVLGKYEVLKCLEKQTEFDLAVRSRQTSETGLHRMLLSLDRAMASKRSPLKRTLEVFSKTLSVLVNSTPAIMTISNTEGDTPFHSWAKVILDCTGELERLNCYKGYFKQMMYVLKDLRAKGKLSHQAVKELLLKTNKCKETFLHILASRDGNKHVVESVLDSIDSEIMDVLKETTDSENKTPSDIAKKLHSYDMAEILRPRSEFVDGAPEKSATSGQHVIVSSPPAKLFQRMKCTSEHISPSSASSALNAVAPSSIIPGNNSNSAASISISSDINTNSAASSSKGATAASGSAGVQVTQTSPSSVASGPSFVASNSGREAEELSSLLYARIEKELPQIQRDLQEKEETLKRVQQRITDAKERRKKLLEELDEVMEEIATATREEGKTLAEIAEKKRDAHSYELRLSKRDEHEKQRRA